MSSKFPVVLHMDCTFKCNDNEFPILILGITDACQQFHPLSISIISHQTTEMYEDMLQNFNRLIPHVLTDVMFTPDYEYQIVSPLKGQYFFFHSCQHKCLYKHTCDYMTLYVMFYINNYRDALIATYPNIKTLMCYFHVVNVCKKNLRSYPAATQKKL